MIRNLFKDKRFIFIFTFIVECILFHLFEYTNITGEFLLIDMGFAPVSGLMFGPVGALGVAVASLIGEIIQGADVLAAIMDSSIMLFLGIFSYKLWYTMFDRSKMDVPRFNSFYNIIKFISIMFIVSIVFLALLEVSFDVYSGFTTVYPLITHWDRIGYFLNNFTFSIILGLLFISGFNTLRIPMQTPKKWVSIINIDYRYFTIAFIILIAIFYMNIFKILENRFVDMFFFGVMIIVSVLYVLNTRDTDVEFRAQHYSIIEQVILVFLIIISILLFAFVDFFEVLPKLLFEDIDSSFGTIVTITFLSLVILVFSMIHIYYVQNLITDPIYGLIESTKRYSQNKDIEKLDDNLLNRSKEPDDIGLLIQSYSKLNDNIKDSLDSIQEKTAENERFETEFNVASHIQSNMLAKDFDEFSKDRSFEIHAYMNPAREVGGDFYDYFDLDDDTITFAIGDVSGKGIPATLFMVKTMHLIRNHIGFSDDLAQVMGDVNDLSCQRNDENLFATVWIGKLNLKNGGLSFVNAGHNPPLIRRANGEFEYMNASPDLVIGAMEDMPYTVHEIQLNPGDIIFLYTDGVTEANHDYNGFYGEERLRQKLNSLKDEKPSVIVDGIKGDLDEFCKNHDQFDDVTMMIIGYDGGINK